MKWFDKIKGTRLDALLLILLLVHLIVSPIVLLNINNRVDRLEKVNIIKIK
jgi:hypothetical protein